LLAFMLLYTTITGRFPRDGYTENAVHPLEPFTKNEMNGANWCRADY